MRRLTLLGIALSVLGFTASPGAPSSRDDARAPAHQTPEQRANWIINEHTVLGRTPASWLSRARSFTFKLPQADLARPQSLIASVVKLYEAVGITVTPAMVTQLEVQQLPSSISNAFSALVGTVADAYGAQTLVARAVRDRLSNGLDPYHPALTPIERDASLDRAKAILDAINLFRARTGSWFKRNPGSARATCAPMFQDPLGLVILGSACNYTYGPSGMFGDPVLLVAPGGNNTFTNSAGGACPVTITDPPMGSGTWMRCNGLVVSVVASIGDGNDTFSYDGEPAPVQGAGGPGGIGMLLKVAGNSTMTATMTRNNAFMNNVVGPLDAGAQGFGYSGVGLLLEGSGNHDHTINVVSPHGETTAAFGQGSGNLGGVGIASDLQGNNSWIANGLGPHLADPHEGYVGVYNAATAAFSGVGILSNTGKGHDVYRASAVADDVDMYALGYAIAGSLAILADDGGGDTYYNSEQALAPARPGLGPDTIINCSIGAAEFGATGIVMEGDGNDSYYGAAIAPVGRGAVVMNNGFSEEGYGVFVKHGGSSTYSMEVDSDHPTISGRGLYKPSPPFVGENDFGTFVALGGHDTFSDFVNGQQVSGPGAPNSVWTFGIDHE